MVQSQLQSGNAELMACDTHKKLYFTLELKDVKIKQGLSIKLTCSVTGFNPVFKWFKDSRPLSFNKNSVINMTKGVTGAIRIIQATPQDAGEYKCIIHNDLGSIETRCIVTVLPNPDIPLVRPRFVMTTDYYVYQFDELILATRIDSKQEPCVEYYKNSDLIELDSGKYSLAIDEDGTMYKLVISHPNRQDSGVYTVKVKNDAGEDTVTHRIDFLGRESHKREDHAKIALPSNRKRQKNSEDIQVDPEFQELLKKRNEIKASLAVKQEEAEKERRSKIMTHAQRVEREFAEIRNRISFEATLKDLIVTEGGVAKFVCSVTGPDPTFKWYKNDEPLNFTKNVKNLSKLNVGSIIIQTVTPKDEGVYKCEVSNKHYMTQSEAKLIVLASETSHSEPPTFTRAIREYYTVATNDLILEVRVRGNPKPTITWLKDCLEVENPEYFAPGKYLCMREPDGVYKFAIHNPQRIDSGTYVCVAANSGGKVEIRHDVRVRSKSEYSHVHGINYADAKEKRHFEDIIIHHKTSEVKPIENVSSESEGIKEENNTSTKDGLEEVQNECTTNVPSSEDLPENTAELKTSDMNVIQTPEIKHPKKPAVPENPKYAIKFLTKLRNQQSLEGCQVRLSCSVDGYNPDYKWYKNGEPVEYSSTIKNISKDSIGCLTIQKVTKNDEGVYTCVISNRFCEILTTARLDIIEKPEEVGQPPIFNRVRHYYDLQIDQLILEIQIIGQPFTNMLWYKDCREIVSNDKYRIAREPNGIYKLCIDKPLRKDCGTYMLQVENQYGMETLKHDIEFWNKNDFVHAMRIEHADPKNKWKKMEILPVQKLNHDSESMEPIQREENISKRYLPFEMPPEISRAEKKKQQLKLEFITSLRNHTILKGNNLKLTCCTSDANKLKVTWLKNGEPIEKTSRIHENVTKEGYCMLEILKTVVDDSGVYECLVKTTLGEATTKCKVSVYELEATSVTDVPPVLATSIIDYYRPTFNDIVIECKITGSPRPRIKWIRDGLQVEFGNKYEYYQKEDGTCQLVVNNPRLIDNGKYIIQAKNCAGELQLTHQLDFEGRKILEKKKKMGTIVIENETKPRVYPKAKELSPSTTRIDTNMGEEPQPKNELEIVEELRDEPDKGNE